MGVVSSKRETHKPLVKIKTAFAMHTTYIDDMQHSSNHVKSNLSKEETHPQVA
jgi:hypothetical protein